MKNTQNPIKKKNFGRKNTMTNNSSNIQRKSTISRLNKSNLLITKITNFDRQKIILRQKEPLLQIMHHFEFLNHFVTALHVLRYYFWTLLCNRVYPYIHRLIRCTNSDQAYFQGKKCNGTYFFSLSYIFVPDILLNIFV